MNQDGGDDQLHERPSLLIVEDSDLLRKMFQQAFQNHHLVYATSGAKEGWSLYLKKNPDIVFLDIGLPDGNGHDLARKIKKHDTATYVVMVTASDHKGDKEDAFYNHVDGFITKPFNKNQIDACIRRYSTHHRPL